MTRKNLTQALLAGLAGTAGLIGSSAAVNINPDGLGQVLIYPYYTVRENQFTTMSVVNTTDRTKAVKVRFLEGKASQEVLDFNLYLSPFDVWTGFVVAEGDDPTGAEGGRLFSNDNSCTVPAIPVGGQPFLTFAYAGDEVEDDSMNRGSEGYIEVIEMGDIENAEIEGWIKHDSDGVPANCAGVRNLWRPSNPTGAWFADAGQDGVTTADTVAGQGGLFGGASVVNGPAGTIAQYTATAIDGFSTSVLHYRPGNTLPSLVEAQQNGILFDNGVLINGIFDSGIDAVSGVLTLDSVINEYVIEQEIAGATDWVFTFPTKRSYVGTDGVMNRPFMGTLGPNGACQSISIAYWDREEQEPFTPPGEINFSPEPPPDTPDPLNLCWEVSVLQFNDDGEIGKGVFGSQNASAVGVEFENGWAQVGFPRSATTDRYTLQFENADDGQDYLIEGLPVVGFAAYQAVNGDVGGALANYTGLFNHRGTRSVTQS